ncbi:MAG: Ig-like domain-containing protein [Trueperaceae bacterium]|nr:Ig-like domain-containing protein [Trueperaceae bacterium]
MRRSLRAAIACGALLALAVGCQEVNVVTGPGPEPDDGPPEVTLTSPAGSTTVSTSPIDIEGTATDQDGIGDVTVANGANGFGAFCAVSGNSFTCSDVELVEGVNLIDVVVRDGDGNQRTVPISVTREAGGGSGAPTLSNVTPQDGATLADQPIDVTGDVSDDGTVASVALENHTEASTYTCTVSGGSFICPDVFLQTGDNDLTITAEDAAGKPATHDVTITYEPPPSSGDFQIELRMFDSDFSASQRAAFEDAVARWESIVTGDLQDIAHDAATGESCEQGEPAFDGTIDDLLIFVTTFTNPSSNTIGLAGPCLTRTSGPDDGTNFVGYMELNTSYLADLEDDGDLRETLVHEIGHVLGFGTNWEFGPFALLDYEPSAGETCETVDSFTQLPVYTGAMGVSAYHDLGESGDIPVEADGRLGTRCGHWDDDTFGNELMTGYLNEGQHNPLSEMSIASLEDIGLEVDRSQAEPYDMALASQATRGEGRNLAAAEILLRPIGSVDVETGEFTPAPQR